MRKEKKRNFEVLLNENAQSALDNFSACFGARIAYFGTDMKELKVGQRKPACSYCSLIRRKLYGDGRCVETDRKMLAEAIRRRHLIHYTCHGGLVEAICPVFLDNAPAGFVMVGQFRTASRPPESIIHDWNERKENSRSIIKAFNEVPEISCEKLPSMLGIFSMLVRSIISDGISSVKGDAIVERILHEIRSRPEKPPTLPEAARLVGRSRSSVSHIFKSSLGRSFKSCVVDIRIERAEQIMRSNPGMTVKEAAAKAGFEDEFYFSRIFRKRRGFPPSKLLSSE